MKEILVFRLSMRSVMVVIIITQWTSRHRGDLFPHSGARPSFPFKYGNRTNAKEPCRPQPSTLYLASDRLRPESWPRKKKKNWSNFHRCGWN